jgi:hypothetical protein
VEERVACQYLLAVRGQPVILLPLLPGVGMQLVPGVRAAAGRAQPGQPQLRALGVGERLQLVKLPDVVPGHRDRDPEALESSGLEIVHRADRRRVRPRAADRVVNLGGRSVRQDLQVDVVAGRQPARRPGVDLDAVGGELQPRLVHGGVIDQLPEVGPDGRLPTADVDVEHLHPRRRVYDVLALGGGQLARVPAPGAGQAVHARQVARVHQFPGQADRRGQPALKLLQQSRHPAGRVRQRQRRRGHDTARSDTALSDTALSDMGHSLIICECARVASARS